LRRSKLTHFLDVPGFPPGTTTSTTTITTSTTSVLAGQGQCADISGSGIFFDTSTGAYAMVAFRENFPATGLHTIDSIKLSKLILPSTIYDRLAGNIRNYDESNQYDLDHIGIAVTLREETKTGPQVCLVEFLHVDDSVLFGTGKEDYFSGRTSMSVVDSSNISSYFTIPDSLVSCSESAFQNINPYKIELRIHLLIEADYPIGASNGLEVCGFDDVVNSSAESQMQPMIGPCGHDPSLMCINFKMAFPTDPIRSN
jgi:hypothetical protein